jgi:glycerol-3-phosphate dehydrogenase (NAD(P)+)
VLGAGSWGTTVASLVARRHETILWARDAEVAKTIATEHVNPLYLPGFALTPKLAATSDIEEATCGADLLVVGVPSSGFRRALVDAAPHMRPWIPVVSLAKGLESGSMLRMTEVIKEVAPGHPVAALTGPNLAHEIMDGKAAASVIATEDLEVARAIQKVFTRGVFRVYLNDDVIGCEMGGALKNVIAIAAGIGEGLGVGDNTRAGVMSRGLAELTRLGVAMGARATTFAGLAGMGDLIVTCWHPSGRNRRAGELMARGESQERALAEIGQVVEGLTTAPVLRELSHRVGVEMPITEGVCAVLSGRPLHELAADLMGRRPTDE